MFKFGHLTAAKQRILKYGFLRDKANLLFANAIALFGYPD
jgi:hypothetical protein